MSMAWITSLYGGYDTMPKHLLQTEPHQSIVVTDNTDLSYPMVPGYAVAHKVECEPRLHMHPRMGAKFAKCMPWEYTDADVIVWTDASIEATDEKFLSFMLHNREKGCCISQFTHPHRNDVLEEAILSATMEKYGHQPVLAQAHYYMDGGFPRHYGLWATGWAVWDLSTPKLRAEAEVLGEAWLLEQTRWTYQDQISQPFVAWKHDIKIGTIPGDIFSPPHSRLRPHNRND